MTRPYARTNAEAHIYMDLHPCACGDEAFERKSAVISEGETLCSRYTGRCMRCGTSRAFVFELPAAIRPPGAGQVEFGGDEASRIIDAGQWMTVAFTHVRRRPSTARDLEIARGAVQETLKFIPPGADRVPEHAFWTRDGRAAWKAHPDWFRTGSLRSYLEVFHQLHERARAAPALEPSPSDPDPDPGSPAARLSFVELVEALQRVVARQHGFAGGELMRQLHELGSELVDHLARPMVPAQRPPTPGELARLADEIARAEAASRQPLTDARDGAASARRHDEMQRIVDRVRIMVERMEPPCDGKDPVPRSSSSMLEARLTSSDPEDVYDAIIDIGKQGHPELADRVAPFLASETPFLREAAVRSLAFHLRAPAYTAEVVRLLTQDPDPGVRAAAAMGLNTFAMKDPELVRQLVEVAVNAAEAEAVRDAAFMSALVGAGVDRAEFPKVGWVPGFERNADWALLARALTRAGIALPPRLAERVLGMR